jgi:DNA-binding MarR family transcriptional regulator
VLPRGLVTGDSPPCTGMRWLRRIVGREAVRTPVDLDVHQQLAMLTLARFGPCSYNRLYADVSAIRRTTPADMANAVLTMEAAGVIERLAELNTAQAQRRYALTKRGRRIARYIPQEPKSAMQFYV